MTRWEKILIDQPEHGELLRITVTAAFAEIRRSREFGVFAQGEVDLLKDMLADNSASLVQLIAQRDEEKRLRASSATEMQQLREKHDEAVRCKEAREADLFHIMAFCTDLLRGLVGLTDPDDKVVTAIRKLAALLRDAN